MISATRGEGVASVRFGAHIGPQQCTMAELREAWAAAERLGFEWISTWDHLYPSTTPLDDPCFEALTCHAALAATTARPRVGCLVYSAGYRHPGMLANAAATIDHLSDGRLELGLGAGWHEAEYEAYGIPFESAAVRFQRLREAVEIIRLLWSEQTVDYDGEFHTLRHAYCAPKPVQQLPRIWIGAVGEQIGLRLAAEIGDGWNAFFLSPDVFARKLDLVRSAAADPERLAVGVNVGLVMADTDSELDVSLQRRFGPGADAVRDATLTGSVGEITDQVGRYVAAGAGWINVALRAPFDLGDLERFANEVIPQFTTVAAR